jgi:outer membrane protein, multidrug efflux system
MRFLQLTPGGTMRGWLATGSLCAVLASGCAVEKPVPAPQIAPPAFEHAPPGQASSWPAQDWYRSFGSTELDDLVDFAARNNTDLAGARERVVQADARAREAGAAILPSVSGNANANYLAGRSDQGSGHELDWLAMLSAS